MENGASYPLDDKVNKIINSVGALAELLGIFYNELINQGLSPDHAYALTQTYLILLYGF